MLPAATERILARLKPSDRILDVGGWAAPFRPSRAAKAGYVEAPTMFAELIYNVEGDGSWLGHEHHRWLVEEEDGGLVFTRSRPTSWRLRCAPASVPRAASWR